MSKQPDALRLADLLDEKWHRWKDDPTDELKAAAELRRLHDLLGKANALNRIRYERIKILGKQRDDLLAVMKRYHKLTAADGWYADLINDTINKVTGGLE